MPIFGEENVLQGCGHLICNDCEENAKGSLIKSCPAIYPAATALLRRSRGTQRRVGMPSYPAATVKAENLVQSGNAISRHCPPQCLGRGRLHPSHSTDGDRCRVVSSRVESCRVVPSRALRPIDNGAEISTLLLLNNNNSDPGNNRRADFETQIVSVKSFCERTLGVFFSTMEDGDTTLLEFTVASIRSIPTRSPTSAAETRTRSAMTSTSSRLGRPACSSCCSTIFSRGKQSRHSQPRNVRVAILLKAPTRGGPGGGSVMAQPSYHSLLSSPVVHMRSWADLFRSWPGGGSAVVQPS